MTKAFLKYWEVGRTNIRSRWAYIWDQLLSAWFMVVVMFVFVQLWKVTYASQGTGALAGFTLPEVVWYLVATESIILSLPRIHGTMESEVKDGDLAVRLNKPYNYLLFHYSSFLGDGILRLLTNFLMGGATAFILVGGFRFHWEALPLMLLVYAVTAALHFCYGASIGLAAFWMEDVAGLYFILDRAKWLLGGFLLPVELYPDMARKVVEVLPFRHMIAGPARLFVKFSWAGAGELLWSQLIWLAVFGLICAGVYRLGVRRVDVNGG